ncbi:MAG: FkbM family methyltransferase [Bacteroidota bacterium]|nr:FkbM family methyltransferase [Bacteroidota bacterium]
MKKLLNAVFYHLGYRVLRHNSNSQDPFKTQKYLLGSSAVTIFEVGAHFGETVIAYNKLFNNPAIYSFEPFSPSFEILKKNVQMFSNVKAYNVALSNFIGKVDFHVNKSSATNSILPTSKDSIKNWRENLLDTVETIKINSTTIDEFVEINNIKIIDILKIDTQGTEYEVIQGASKTIEQNKIKMIYLEIIVISTYEKQRYPDEILFLLRSKGFHLFNQYNYTYSSEGELQQFDAIFVHESFRHNN